MNIQTITFQPKNSNTDYTVIESNRYIKDHFLEDELCSKDICSYKKYMPAIKYGDEYFIITHYDNESECKNAIHTLKDLFNMDVYILTYDYNVLMTSN